MFGKEKRRIASLIAISTLLFSCGKEALKIEGQTQGTTYHIIVSDEDAQLTKLAIDSILSDFDRSLSAYIDSSVISKMNRAHGTYNIPVSDIYFIPCYQISQRIFLMTKGAFDPSVFPLVEAWGFMKKMKNPPTQTQVDSLLQFVDFTPGVHHSLLEEKRTYRKRDSRFRLDFNAIAQGYSVDVLAEYLQKKGMQNFFVEIGGEIRVQGLNPSGEPWNIGVDVPEESNSGRDGRAIGQVLSLKNGALATSGNYRKFYEKDGKKYAHTLNPRTGMPAENEILSATILGENAAESDGVATAIMVMGLTEAKIWLSKNTQYQALLNYALPNGSIGVYATAGMKKLLQ